MAVGGAAGLVTVVAGAAADRAPAVEEGSAGALEVGGAVLSLAGGLAGAGGAAVVAADETAVWTA